MAEKGPAESPRAAAGKKRSACWKPATGKRPALFWRTSWRPSRTTSRRRSAWRAPIWTGIPPGPRSCWNRSNRAPNSTIRRKYCAPIAGLFLHLDAPDRLEEDPVKPVYVHAIEQLRSGAYDLALQRFIEVLEKNRAYDDDGARKSCVAIFGMLGETHPTTRQYRRAFSNALYA